LVDVNQDMGVMKDETFGPVIPIMKVRDAAEALRRANDSPYGLGASIFCRDPRSAATLAEQIESGSVCVNDTLVNFIIPDTAMGGVKESGFGYRHGVEGIRKYCRQKSIVTDRFGLKQEFPWYPASEKKARQVRHLLRLLCRSGWRNKWTAFKELVKG
jgi:acyl-CoA reductase-like NAD-dependent aldehyde dehydrogenase